MKFRLHNKSLVSDLELGDMVEVVRAWVDIDAHAIYIYMERAVHLCKMYDSE